MSVPLLLLVVVVVVVLLLLLVAFRYSLEIPPFLGSPVPFPDVAPLFVGQSIAPFLLRDN